MDLLWSDGDARHHCGSTMMYLVLNFAAVIYDEKNERKEEGDLDLRSQIDHLRLR
jgi:hypothetical protein